MRTIPSSTGSISKSETSGEDGSIADAFTGNFFLKNESISKANIVPIERVLKYYGVNVNKFNRKAVCPFKSHKGGRENSASFTLYPETNTYNCFGCGNGGKVVHFVSTIDNISPFKAAAKILELFGDSIDDNADDELYVDPINFSEQLEIMMLFSEDIRDFRQNFIDEKSRAFIDNICKTYDDICLKHELDNEALRALIEKYQRKIKVYKSCL